MDINEAAFSIEFKGGNSPSSEANMKVNARINPHVLPADIPTISEENTHTGYTIRKSW